MGGEDLVLRFIGINLISKIADEIAGAVSGLGKHMIDQGNMMGAAFLGVGTAAATVGVALLGISAGLTAIAVHAAFAAGEFERQMTLSVTQAGAARTTIDALRQSVLDLAPAVGIGPDELAKALYHIESVLPNNAKDFDILRVAARGAALGYADLEQTATALVGVMVTGIKGAEDAATAMGYLHNIVGAGNLTMTQLVTAMGSGFMQSAKLFGLSIIDVGGALATMTDMGIPADQAANRLRMTFALLAAPTRQSTNELKALGLADDQIVTATQRMTDMLTKAGVTHSMLADAMRGPGGLSAAMHMLKDHMDAAGLDAGTQADLIARAFGGGRSATGIMTLLDNLPQLDAKTRQVAAGATVLDSAWIENEKHNPIQHVNELRAAWQALVIEMGSAVAPMLVRFVDYVKPIVVTISHWIATHQELTAKLLIGAAVGAAIVGVFLLIFGVIAITIGVIAGLVAGAATLGISLGAVGTVIAVVAGIMFQIGLVSYLLITHWKQIVAFGHQVGAVFMDIRDRIWLLHFVIMGLPGRFIEAVTEIYLAAVLWVSNTWNWIATTTMGGVNRVTGFFGMLVAAAGRAWAAFTAHPMYWLGFLIGFMIGWVLRMQLQLAVWAAHMILTAENAAFGFISAVAIWLALLPGNVAMWLLGVMTAVGRWEIDMGVRALRAGTAFYINLGRFLIALPGNVASWFASVMFQVALWEADMALHALRAGVSFRTWLLDELGKLPGQMEKIGQDIAHGIINGILSMGNWVKTQASDFVTGIVAGMKAAISASSPSQLAATDVGLPIPQGLAQGINTGTPLVRASYLNMLSVVGGNFGTGSSSASLISVHVTPVVNPVTDTGQTDAVRKQQSAQATSLADQHRDLLERIEDHLSAIRFDDPGITGMGAYARTGG